MLAQISTDWPTDTYNYNVSVRQNALSMLKDMDKYGVDCAIKYNTLGTTNFTEQEIKNLRASLIPFIQAGVFEQEFIQKELDPEIEVISGF